MFVGWDGLVGCCDDTDYLDPFLPIFIWIGLELQPEAELDKQKYTYMDQIANLKKLFTARK